MSEQTDDNPGLDGTDGAHPAWWRGQDAGAIGAATKIAKAAEGGHSCEAMLANVLRVASEIIDGAGSRSVPLYTKPAWLTEAETWLVGFRAAVEAAGLEWVAPIQSSSGKYEFMWAGASLEESLLVSISYYAQLRWLGKRSTAQLDGIPACVALYRRWLAARSRS